MQNAWGRGSPAWGGGPWGWGDLERHVPGAFIIQPQLLGVAVGGCPCNQPPHSLPLAHGVMNPEVPAPCQRLPCSPSLPNPALPPPQAHPSHFCPLSAVPSLVFASAPVQQKHSMGAWAPGTAWAVAALAISASMGTGKGALPGPG